MVYNESEYKVEKIILWKKWIIMKLLINIILVLIVLAGFGGMIYLSVNGNRFLGAAGLAMLYFVGSIGYFVNCYTIKKRGRI